jgi:5-methylcytosine-specific restriction endonuclease McrA
LEPIKNTELTQGQIEHREYLKSHKWMKKRDAVIIRAGHHCEGCGVYLGEKGQVHHKTYDNWKNEFLCELIYLCKECHDRMHHG